MRTTTLARSLGFLVLLLAAAHVPSARAQTGKITGVVTDAQTGQPIEGVSVFLLGTGRGAVTGANGRYFILSVPPGEYTVGTRRIGYQAAERRGVQVAIDVTREVNFQLASAAGQLAPVKVEAQATPLIQPGTTGSQTALTAGEITALPVQSIASVLSLQLGYLNVPVENIDVTSYVDERRGVNQARVRGGRAAETVTLIDGIPVNNFVLGGPGIDPNTEVVEALNYQRGGFEAQYGNAMSGVINIATREGGATPRGALNYQTSRVAGALGSDADDQRGADHIQGFFSGPVPGTGQRLRFIAAGRHNTSAHRALQFDDIIFNPFGNPADPRGYGVSAPDLFAGWRGVGFLAQRDLFGKLTAYFTPQAKLGLGILDYQNQSQYYNHAFSLSGFDVVARCKEVYPDGGDYCERAYAAGQPRRYEDIMTGDINVTNNRANQQYVIQGSTRTTRQLAWGNFNHTIGRTNYQVRAGRLEATRSACNYLAGVCLGDKIRNPQGVQDFFIGQFTNHSRHNAPYVNPTAGTENFAGGDTNTTYSVRADLQSQVTDHHNIQGGVFYQRHDIRFYEASNVTKPFDQNTVVNYVYGGKPWDAAIYVQDRVEYDFLTLKLGFRFDYTHAPGRFFRDPLDPTNGTTAFEVCQGAAPSLGANAPYELTAGTRTLTGIAACAASPDSLMAQATRLAATDDFGSAPVRRQFSPRIGVQFPLTERTSFFANWGIYSQNPTYNAMYSGTGIGRNADSTLASKDVKRLLGVDSIRRGSSLEGTPFGPNFRQDAGTIPRIGNPGLAIERTSAYELGFLGEFGRNYAFQLTAFAKDQSGLVGYRRGGVTTDGRTLFDVGQTYNQSGTGLNYFVLVNTDFQTVRGFEVIFRRSLANFWALTLQYGFQQVFANAAPPDLEIQKYTEGDTLRIRREIRSEIDQPHLFTGILRFEFDDRVPSFRFANLLKHTRVALTTRAASGLPYTPALTFTGAPQDRLERNSGTGPMTWSLDLRAEKGWRAGGIRYSGFVSITNLLDRRNCLQPYPTTGRCDAGALPFGRLYTGVRQAGPGDAGVSMLVGGSLSQYDRPHLFGERRAIYSGLRVSF